MDEEVKTWMHSRQGLITAVEVRGGNDTWMYVRLVGDHRKGEDGEIVTFRREFMTEVPK